ncbi:MAG: zinc ribbon domain-containing protein [Pseudomonadota bacterium]
MPIYEYVCKACGAETDALQKIADAPLTDCPSCGASELKRKISAPSFRLKGQGWYETDFKTDKDKRRNLADGGDGGKKSEAKADKAADKSSGKTGGDGKAA